ncbi:MAG: hypothetical protein IJ120_00905 [Solobacterium sp.]|nr:hypothetical protein [Solobacterium sp.]
MRKKITLKLFLVGGLASVLLSLLAAGFQLCMRLKLNLRTTYVAARTIPPRTQITEADLTELQIPADYLLDYTYTDKEDIVGKYTEIQGMIPAGSAFYKSMLYREEELPDHPSTQLRSGQAAYTMEVDLARLGGTVVPGQRVDVYFAAERKDAGVLTGCLIRNVRVIAVKDHRGIDLDREDSSGTPYLAVLAVQQQDISLLTLAEEVGSVRMFTSDETYSSDLEASRAEDSPVLGYLYEAGGATLKDAV